MEPIEYLVGAAMKRAAFVLKRPMKPLGMPAVTPPKPMAPVQPPSRVGGAALTGLGLGLGGWALSELGQGYGNLSKYLGGLRSDEQAATGR